MAAPAGGVALGVIQAIYLLLPISAYPPGHWLAMLSVGALLHRAGAQPLDLGPPAWVNWLGRHPLTVYVGHLVVIAIVVAGLEAA